MEKDDEVQGAGNIYSFEFRIQDSRLGRFLSIDPLTKTYPWNSPYAFAENDVVRAIDLEGLEKWVNTKSELIYGPFSPEYVKNEKLKSVFDVVSSEKLVSALERGQSSQTFIGNQKAARIYDKTTIKDDEPGTVTRPTIQGGARINIDNRVANPNEIFNRVAFELTNAASFVNGYATNVVEQIKGGMTKESFIKQVIRTEMAGLLELEKMKYETGDKSISKERYNEINNNGNAIVDKMVQSDYDNGTRETATGTRKTTEVYGEQYDQIQSYIKKSEK